MARRNKHVQIFINGAVAFGIFATIVLYLQGGRLVDVILGIASGITFGAGMAWFSTRTERRLAAKGYVVSDMSPTQERRISLSVSDAEALAIAQAALATIPRINNIIVNPDAKTISARVGGGWKGWGDNITVAVSNADGASVLTIRSEPRDSAAIFDDGAGIENVETFVRAIDPRIVRRADT
jgi:hypothetical protein